MSIIIKGGASPNLANVDVAGNLLVSLANSAPPFDRTATGSFVATETLPIGLEGSATVRTTIQGSFTGTLFFESTLDGLAWFPFLLIPYLQTTLNNSSLAGVTQTSITGNWQGNTGGFFQFRVRGAISSGSAVVTIQVSQAVSVVNSFELNDGFIDANNTSITPLGSNAVFTGLMTDVLPFTSVKISLFTDQSSATNGFSVQFSIDGTNWDFATPATVAGMSAGGGQTFSFARTGRFFRIVYTNGAIAQTTFRLNTTHQRTTPKDPSNPMLAAVTQNTTPWIVAGDSASGVAKAGNPVQIGGVFNTVQPTVTTGQTVEAQATARGAQIVATGTDTFNTTINTALPAGTNVIGHVIADSGSTTVVTGNVTVVQATATNLKVDLSGTAANSTAIKVDGSAVTQPVSGTFFQATQPISGTITANIGTSGSLALDATLTGGTQQSKITDGTNIASVKAASTAAIATDKALVIAVSPNNSVAVTGTFFQATQPVSGTVTSNIGTTNGLALDATVTGGLQLSSLGTTNSKSLIMKTGTLVTTAVTADQVVLTYTVTAGKTLFLEYLQINAGLTAATNNGTNLGTVSLESPAGTKLATAFLTTQGSALLALTFAESLFIAASTVVRVVVTPASTTSMTYVGNFGGFER